MVKFTMDNIHYFEILRMGDCCVKCDNKNKWQYLGYKRTVKYAILLATQPIGRNNKTPPAVAEVSACRQSLVYTLTDEEKRAHTRKQSSSAYKGKDAVKQTH